MAESIDFFPHLKCHGSLSGQVVKTSAFEMTLNKNKNWVTALGTTAVDLNPFCHWEGYILENIQDIEIDPLLCPSYKLLHLY